MRRRALDTAFDLVAGPVYRAVLILAEEERCLFLFTVHHIASDGWSQDLLLHELARLYAAFAAGEPRRCAPLAFQYRDYAAWLDAGLAGDRGAALLAYWREKLADLEPLELPADRPRPAIFTDRGGSYSLRLDRELALQLRRFQRERGDTLFVIFAALLGETLGRFAGRAGRRFRYRVGRPQPSGGRGDGRLLRQHPGAAHLAGRRTQPARAGGAHPRSAGRRARPPGHALRPAGRRAAAGARRRPPSAGAGFFPGPRRRHPARLPGPRAAPAAPRDGHRPLRPSLTAVADGERRPPRLLLLRRPASPATIEALFGAFLFLLRQALAAPERPLASFAALPPEQAAILQTAPSHATGAPRSTASLIELFDEQVATGGDRCAVSEGERRQSYDQLDHASRQLAARLHRAGLRAGGLAAICLPRSIDNLVAILAVLRCGATAAPLDPPIRPSAWPRCSAISAGRC